MTTKEARRVLRQYHEAVKALVAEHTRCDGADSGFSAAPHPDQKYVVTLRTLLPQADAAVKALTERFP